MTTPALKNDSPDLAQSELRDMSVQRRESDVPHLNVGISQVLTAADFKVEGDRLQIDYPFQCGFRGLCDEGSAQAIQVYNNIDLLINEIQKKAVELGLSDYSVFTALDELLKNATYYGALSADNLCVGKVDIQWKFEQLNSSDANEETRFGLELEISNPCYRLFNPSIYVFMDPEKLANEEEHTTEAAHYGMFFVLSGLRPESKLSYLIDLKEAGKVSVGMWIDGGEPQVEITRLGSSQERQSYDLESFLRDVHSGQLASSVSVSLLL